MFLQTRHEVSWQRDISEAPEINVVPIAIRPWFISPSRWNWSLRICRGKTTSLSGPLNITYSRGARKYHRRGRMREPTDSAAALFFLSPGGVTGDGNNNGAERFSRPAGRTRVVSTLSLAVRVASNLPPFALSWAGNTCHLRVLRLHVARPADTRPDLIEPCRQLDRHGESLPGAMCYYRWFNATPFQFLRFAFLLFPRPFCFVRARLVSSSGDLHDRFGDSLMPVCWSWFIEWRRNRVLVVELRLSLSRANRVFCIP